MTGTPKVYTPGWNEYLRARDRLTHMTGAYGRLTVLPHEHKSGWAKDSEKTVRPTDKG